MQSSIILAHLLAAMSSEMHCTSLPIILAHLLAAMSSERYCESLPNSFTGCIALRCSSSEQTFWPQ